MSRQLREALREVATGSPALSPPPSGLFDRARREQTRRRVTTVLATILAVATVAVSTGFFPAAPVVTASSIVLPRHFVGPPKWTADIRDAPVERAVLAFVKSIEPQKLVIIGPESVYRTYSVPAEGYSTWTPSFLLSPDGRSVLVARGQRTELLDLGTGRVTLLEIGAPLAWSRDGTHAVVVNEAASEFHVVQIPAGIVVWRIPMRPAEELVAAAFSPDLTRLAVQQGSTMSVYQRSGMLWSKEVGMTPALAGPLAWTPDGAAIALA